MSKYSDPGLEQMPDITQAIMREADAAADAYRAEPTRENRKRRALAFERVREDRRYWREIRESQGSGLVGIVDHITADGDPIGDTPDGAAYWDAIRSLTEGADR